MSDRIPAPLVQAERARAQHGPDRAPAAEVAAGGAAPSAAGTPNAAAGSHATTRAGAANRPPHAPATPPSFSWRRFSNGRPWLGSCIAAVIAWAITVATGHGQGAGSLLTVALSFSAFTILVSLGQMLVISVGPGNADLSIPSTIALSGAVAMIVMNGDNALIVPGLLAAVAIGMLVGAANFGLIRLLRIPPIIATLAGSLIVMSIAINVGRGLKIKPPPLFADATTLRLAGIPLIALIALAASVWIALMLQRTRLGRSIEAVGQSERAARLAGIAVQRTRLLVYVICAGLAGLVGALISGFAGGNSLDAGQEYLLLTIAVVVIGGTSVSGGRPSVPGIWGAAMFMFLLVAMLNAANAGPGLRMLLTGLVIIAVITFGSSSGGKRG